MTRAHLLPILISGCLILLISACGTGNGDCNNKGFGIHSEQFCCHQCYGIYQCNSGIIGYYFRKYRCKDIDNGQYCSRT